MITKPQLPPKAGYVEVEIDGVRQYQKVDSPYAMAEEVEEHTVSILDVQEMTVDQEFRLVLLELGV